MSCVHPLLSSYAWLEIYTVSWLEWNVSVCMEATTITWNRTRGTCKKDQSYSIDLPAWPIVWGATTVLVAAAETGILFVINGGTWRDQFDIVILLLVWPFGLQKRWRFKFARLEIDGITFSLLGHLSLSCSFAQAEVKANKPKKLVKPPKT